MSSTSAAAKKQDEKHLKILRHLLTLPENNRCMECPSKQLTYVNLFNNSFVCMRCSGLVREFNHRVKSISASSFTPDEIKALQEGGNEVCRLIWMATWTTAEFALPTLDDVPRLREFLRFKYQSKKWYKEDGAKNYLRSHASASAVPSPAPPAADARFSFINKAVGSVDSPSGASTAFPASSAMTTATTIASAPATSSRHHKKTNELVDFMSDFAPAPTPSSAPPTNATASSMFMGPPSPTAYTSFVSNPASSPSTTNNVNQFPATNDLFQPMSSAKPAAAAPPATSGVDRYDVFRDLHGMEGPMPQNQGSGLFGGSSLMSGGSIFPEQTASVFPSQQASGGIFAAQPASGGSAFSQPQAGGFFPSSTGKPVQPTQQQQYGGGIFPQSSTANSAFPPQQQPQQAQQQQTNFGGFFPQTTSAFPSSNANPSTQFSQQFGGLNGFPPATVQPSPQTAAIFPSQTAFPSQQLPSQNQQGQQSPFSAAQPALPTSVFPMMPAQSVAAPTPAVPNQLHNPFLSAFPATASQNGSATSAASATTTITNNNPFFRPSGPGALPATQNNANPFGNYAMSSGGGGGGGAAAADLSNPFAIPRNASTTSSTQVAAVNPFFAGATTTAGMNNNGNSNPFSFL